MTIRAFIGDPQDAHGKPLPCVYCDKRAFMVIATEALCLGHMFHRQRERDAWISRRRRKRMAKP